MLSKTLLVQAIQYLIAVVFHNPLKTAFDTSARKK
jgi:hypothetical protein